MFPGGGGGGGGVRYSLVNNVHGVRYSLGYRIHSDTGCPHYTSVKMSCPHFRGSEYLSGFHTDTDIHLPIHCGSCKYGK